MPTLRVACSRPWSLHGQIAQHQRLALRCFCVGSQPEFEHPGDEASARHLPRTGEGGFARANFVRETARSIADVYDLKGSLGDGAYGSVFKATHLDTEAVVAVKSIPKNCIQDAEALALEIELLKVADHPNVIRLHETFEDEKSMYLVMELCSGGELWQRIVSTHLAGCCFCESDLASAMHQMFCAVAYCHSHSIVHRDLKPQNFLFASDEPDALMKLVDFGVSGVVPATEPGVRFLTRQAGTDGYIAPEILQSRPYGPAADVFSLGAIMHAAVVGVPPRWSNEKQAYVFPGRLRWSTLSPEAQALLARLTDADPSIRPTAAEALHDPWFRSAVSRRGEAGQAMLDDECLDRMRRFGERSKLQRAVLCSMVVFARLRSAEVEALQRAFLAADTDGSGEVDAKELAAVLNCESEARRVLEGLDFSRDGKISYTEWLAAAASHAWSDDREGARRAFDALDADGDELLSVGELEEALPGVFKPEELALEIQGVDADGDGYVNFAEFCALLQVAGGPASAGAPAGA